MSRVLAEDDTWADLKKRQRLVSRVPVIKPSPKIEMNQSEMEGVDLFYNVSLEDRTNPRLSGESYWLLEHPFERNQPKSRPVPQQTIAIIEIVIQATNIPFPLIPPLGPTGSDDSEDDDEDDGSGNSSDSESDSHEDEDKKPKKTRSESQHKTSWKNMRERFVKRLENYQLDSFTIEWLYVHSPHLQELLRSVIIYYPSYNLKGNKIEFRPPFNPLMHYYNDLVSLKTKNESEQMNEQTKSESDLPGVTSSEKPSQALDKDTLHALNVLLAYLEPIHSSTVQPEELKYQEGLASFGLLWFLFKPGTDVYARVDGKLAAFVVEEFSDSERPRPKATIACWSLEYKSRRVTKVTSRFNINAFIGEKEITSLTVFPCAYLDKTDKGKTRACIEASGAKYYEVLKQVPTFRAYQGQAWRKKEKRSRSKSERIYVHDGQIIVDPRGVISPVDTSRGYGSDSDYDSDSNESSIESDEEDESEDPPSGVGQSPFAPVIIDPKTNPSLTTHQYFLLPRRIKGFNLKSKKWLEFDIEFISDITWSAEGDDPMSKLILGSTDIDILKALSRAHGSTAPVWSADFIPGKGEGQIFLLHECVADFTRRPLLSLTVADIGTSEKTMENNLHRWFEMAASWDAIILIDEADVFLEKRTVADLKRNSLVSVFLRCMEYYTGMLFLTTNRIGHIDDAFLSRMSVALTYDTLDNTKQKLIWKGFLNKLRKERKDISLTGRAETYLESLHLNEDTKDIPWNGREIRNALQIAIALATHDAAEEAKENNEKVGKIRVERDHFEKVIDRRKAFIKYRDSIRNKDENQRAFVEGTRALPPKGS